MDKWPYRETFIITPRQNPGLSRILYLKMTVMIKNRSLNHTAKNGTRYVLVSRNYSLRRPALRGDEIRHQLQAVEKFRHHSLIL